MNANVKDSSNLYSSSNFYKSLIFTNGVSSNIDNSMANDELSKLNIKLSDSMSFHVSCPGCEYNTVEIIRELEIPKFGPSLLRSLSCENCLFRSSEVKSILPYGKRGKVWTLHVSSMFDLNRYLIISDYASVKIPDIQLEISQGGLGGLFTTVEGLIYKLKDVFKEEALILKKDYLNIMKKVESDSFMISLMKLATNSDALPFSLILDDPTDLSFISEYITVSSESNYDSADSNLSCEFYDRTDEQNNCIGLSVL